MKTNQIIKLILIVLISINSSSAYSKDLNKNRKWAISVLQKIKTSYSTTIIKNKNYTYKIKLTIDKGGYIKNSEFIEAKGDIFFVNAVTRDIINAIPLPKPPKYLNKSDRTITLLIK